VEEPVTAQAKEETSSSLRARDIGGSTTPGTFGCSDRKKKIMVVHLDQLSSYQGTLRREQREQLESNHHENRTTGKEGMADHIRHKHSPRKRSSE
jgi:hypothetical protein